jgi:hypothetical protein
LNERTAYFYDTDSDDGADDDDDDDDTYIIFYNGIKDKSKEKSIHVIDDLLVEETIDLMLIHDGDDGDGTSESDDDLSPSTSSLHSTIEESLLSFEHYEAIDSFCEYMQE